MNKFGYTTSRSSIHVSISFWDTTTLKMRYDLENLNRFKFCVAFDEDYVYERFPNRKDNLYAKSIKKIKPIGIHFKNTHFGSFTSGYKIATAGYINDKLKSTAKYYGVNFLKLQDNYVEFRYLGGKDYEKKEKETIECINHFILSLRDTLKINKLTRVEAKEINDLYKQDLDKLLGFADYEHFQRTYPKIRVLVDLSDNKELIKLKWGFLYEIIYYLIAIGNFKSGIVNYDTDLGKVQVKDSPFYITDLDDIEGLQFLNCKFKNISVMRNEFKQCNFNNCILEKCIISNSNVIGSKLTDSSTTNSYCEDTFISNHSVIYDGKFKKCVFTADLPNNYDEEGICEKCIFVAPEVARIKKDEQKKAKLKVINKFKKYRIEDFSLDKRKNPDIQKYFIEK